MNNSKSRFLVPSLADVFFLCSFLFLSLYGGKKLLSDAGTGFHIRTGQYIIAHMSVPRYDVFSHITPPLPWFAHEWLSAVIMASIHQVFGLTGIVLFFSFLISLTYFLLFKFGRANGGNLVFAALVVLLALVSSTFHWLARPHIFTLFLALLWYYVLESYHRSDKNYLFLLPLTMLLWVNLHGGFVIGFVLLAIYLAGCATEALFASAPRNSLSKSKFRTLTCIALACLLFSLVNPAGYEVLLFPFKLVLNQSLVNIMTEYQSPDFHESHWFKYLLLLTIAILAISRAKVNLIEVALVLVFTYMALYSVRHIPLFAIIIAPVLIRHMDSILEHSSGKLAQSLKERSHNLAFIDGRLRGHFCPLVALLLIGILAGTGTIKFGFDEATIPVAGVQFLKREKITGNMYNPEQFGDYVIYAAWPAYKVFIDGRIDMYGTDRVKEYVNVAMAQPGWEKVLRKYDINFVFHKTNSPISQLLAQRDDWKLIYADSVANIFVRDSVENQRLIRKYPNVKPR
jgi:hypothetical protein